MQMKLNVPKVFWVSATALACGLSMAFLGRPLLRGSQNKSLTASGPKVPSPVHAPGHARPAIVTNGGNGGAKDRICNVGGGLIVRRWNGV
jgi:hypothetical protein